MKAIKYIAAAMMVVVAVLVWGDNMVASFIALAAAAVTLIPVKR